MKKSAILLLCIALNACDKADDKAHQTQPAVSQTQNEDTDTIAKRELVESISGVWAGDAGGLITIEYKDNQLRFIIGDDPKYVRLGDVDTSNETINLILARASDNKEIIWTIRRIWNKDKTAFTLTLILDDGSSENLGFVRKISIDDITRIENLYAPTQRSADTSQAENITQSPDTSKTPSGLQPEEQSGSPDSNGTNGDETTNQSVATPNVQPSFDCSNTRDLTEGVICQNPTLASKDFQMAELFQQLMTTSIANAVKDEQRYWLKFVRNQCTTPDCLSVAYDNRIAQLRNRLSGRTVEQPLPSDVVTETALKFYQALGNGNGASAAGLVIPEKREAGPLSAVELSKFYGNLGSKFIIDGTQQTAMNQATVRYRYREHGGKACYGLSIVTLSNRNGQALIEKIDAPNKC